MTYRTGSQIDNWLVSSNLDAYLGTARALPGVCGEDHRAVLVPYYVDIEPIQNRLERPTGSITKQMSKENIATWTEGVFEHVEKAIESIGENTDHAGVLRVFQEAMMQYAKTVVSNSKKEGETEGKEDRSNESKGGEHGKSESPGDAATKPRATSKRERLRSKVGKWFRITDSLNKWSGALTKRWEGKGFWREQVFKDNEARLTAKELNNRERRKIAIQIGEEELNETYNEFNGTNKERGDKILETMEEAVTQNTGTCMYQMFKILRRACGAKETSGAKLMSMYKDDDKEKGEVVRGPGIREEVVKIGTKINAKRAADMPAVRELLAWLKEYPSEGRKHVNVAKDICTWEACKKAINGAKPGKGLGPDGFDGYLLRQGPEELQKLYHGILINIVETEQYPAEWNDWIAMLAMKPGEDPKEMGRRRDLWLQCHSEKCLMRMVKEHYDHVAWETVPSSQAGFTPHRNAPEQSLVLRLMTEQSMMERTTLAKGYVDYVTFFMSCVNEIIWEVEKWAGVAPEVTDVMKALREGLVDENGKQRLEGLSGRYETEYGLTDKVPIMQGVGQGDITSPARAKLMLGVIQKTINRLCPGCPMRLDGRRLALLFFADDAILLTDSVHTLQLAFECTWLVSRIMGLTMGVNGKKKTCWAATYWENGIEKDVSGWEITLPDGTVVPQLVSKTEEGETVNETYKYLGTEMRAGWADGHGHDETRAKVVRKCRQLIGLIGRAPLATQQQMSKAISLAISGTIGYYCRSTALTWGDAVQIEKARVAALRARGFTEGVPRLQIYDTHARGGMGHEHAYAVGVAALRDQIDRALCGRDGEPARAAVEEAIAKTCRRLGCRGTHPLEWVPAHLCNKTDDGGELRDNLLIESYLAGMVRCGWRGKLTAGGETRSGPLDAKHWGLTREERYKAGPWLWEPQKEVWNTEGKKCTYSRRMAKAGIATWADITNKETGEWLTQKQAGDIYGLDAGADQTAYTRLLSELESDEWGRMRDEWKRAVKRGEVDGHSTREENEPWTKWKKGTWNVQEIMLARRAPLCVGGWEYKIKWEEGYEDSWIPEINITTRKTADMQAQILRARETRYIPSSFIEWLMREQASRKNGSRRFRYAIQTCRVGRGSGLSEVWKLFLEYRDATVQIDASENMKDTPASEGGCEKTWTPSEMRTCYLGDKKTKVDDDGKEHKFYVTGLEANESWEQEITPDLKVTGDTVREKVEEDANRRQHQSSRLPKHQPHRWVDMNEESEMLWQRCRDRGIDITKERAPTLDPVLRIFLRCDTIENGTEITVGGIKAKMDKKEQKHFQSGTHSRCEPERTAHASSNEPTLCT